MEGSMIMLCHLLHRMIQIFLIMVCGCRHLLFPRGSTAGVWHPRFWITHRFYERFLSGSRRIELQKWDHVSRMPITWARTWLNRNLGLMLDQSSMRSHDKRRLQHRFDQMTLPS